jgi:iron complex outermembrane receptor protein
MVRRSLSAALAALPLSAAVAAAQQPSPLQQRAAADSAARLGAVQVTGATTGQNRDRTVNLLGKVALTTLPPGTSALKAVERFPGVNFQSSDPWGLYEWSNRVSMRGFLTSQIGQTFDGITLGDMSYGNFSGLGIGRAVDVENMGAVSVLQGTGALGTASSNNLGGVIEYTSDDPRNTRGLFVKQAFGTANAFRTTGRWDTGLLSHADGKAGFKGYVSVSRYDTDKWKGSYLRASPSLGGDLLGDNGLFRAGEQWQEQVNVKLQEIWGPHKFTVFYNFSNRTEGDYADLSLGRFNTSGRDWDQFTDWNVARQFATSQTPDEAYWQSAHGARLDNLFYAKADFGLGERSRFFLQGYAHTNEGAGDWHAPSYGGAFSPDPIYFRQTQYDTERFGFLGRFNTTIAGNAIEAGFWYEDNTPTIRRKGWRLQNYQAGPTVNFSDVLILFFDRTGEIATTQAFVQNTNTLFGDRLKLTYGVKYLQVDADFRSNGRTDPNARLAPDVARPSFSAPTDGRILPQVGAVWQATRAVQLYGNVSQNMNVFPYSPQTGIYNTSAAGFQFFRDNVDNELATSIEGGVRLKRETIEASLGAYTIDYRNRLIGVAVCPPTATCVSSFNNVGSLSSMGAEGLFLWKVSPSVTWFTSASYTDATIDEDYFTNPSNPATRVRSGGKTVVDMPNVLATTNLRWERGNWFATGGARYVGERYFTVENDLSVPSYTLVDAGLGWSVPRAWAARELRLQLNVLNLLDEEYIGVMGTNGFTVRGDNQTLQPGPSRQVFFSVSTIF